MTLLALSGVSLVAFVVGLLRKPDQRGHGLARQRLQRLGDRLGDRRGGSAELSILRDSSERIFDDSGSRFTLLRRRLVVRLELLLYRAQSDAGVGRLLLLTLSLASFFGILGVRIFLNWWIGIGLALVGLLIPCGVFAIRAKRRMNVFEATFPEALALVSRSLRGGHALQRSLRIVADEMEGPVSKEFTLVADQLSLGRDMPEVLDGLSHRVGLPDVDLFASGVLLQREYGGNLAEVVDKLAQMIRERFKFHSKVMAITSANRNSALILLIIPFLFVILMYFANRDFVRPLWETLDGNLLAGAASLLAITGYALARRMARVEA
jgi:tight adherence protein B